MSRNQAHPGCYLVFLVIVFGSMYLYNACDEKFYEPKREAKKKAELVSYWSKPTLNYFEDFDCSKLQYNLSETQITKFFIIESHLNHKCEISKYTLNEFDTIKKLQPYLTKKIDEANVIVWLSSFGGEAEGNYTDGSPAHRLFAEINFISKKENTIFKKVIVKYNGTPLNSIQRLKNQTASNVYFGNKPLEEISEIIISQTK